MEIKAIIFDLDNTLYLSSSIADELFAPVYKVIGDANEKLRALMARKPFQDIAKQFDLPAEVEEEALKVLRSLSWTGEIEPFPAFNEAMNLPVRKFLVTAGFTTLQYSKLQALELKNHFEAMYIIDPEVSGASKKDRFAEILESTGLKPQEVLVVGDDYESEIEAGLNLGMPVVLFDSLKLFEDKDVPRIAGLSELKYFL